MLNQRLIVMKFGGTSVVTESTRELMIKHVIREVNDGNKVLVVVSAMGRYGSCYATDTLGSLVSNNITAKESDRLYSCGEVISSIVVTDLARKNNLNVDSLDPTEVGIITDDNYTDATIIKVETKRLIQKFDDFDVLIAPGFVATSLTGFVTTLGRGGSDTSAVALGASVNADFVDIYSDVPGVMTADPKTNPGAVLIKEMNHDRLIEMAEAGARVIHLKAIRLAKEKNVTMRFRSTFEDFVGTVVKNDL